MAAHHRWATVATVTAALIIGLQGTAAADTVSGTGSLPYPIVVCGVPTAGKTTGTTPTTTSPPPGTSPTPTPTTGTPPAPPTTTTTGTTNPSLPCIAATGNVFIFYIIAVTTTTTVTTVSAPILAANGSITWVSGVPIVPAAAAAPAGTSTAASQGVAATGQGAAATGQGTAAASGWVQCVATSTSTVTNASTVRCPMAPPGSTSGKGKLKLMCEPAPVAKGAVRSASQAHRPARTPTRGHKKRTTRFTVYCRSM
jgi:hypothetical protein